MKKRKASTKKKTKIGVKKQKKRRPSRRRRGAGFFDDLTNTVEKAQTGLLNVLEKPVNKILPFNLGTKAKQLKKNPYTSVLLGPLFTNPGKLNAQLEKDVLKPLGLAPKRKR